VYPSIVTGLVIPGRALCRFMVLTAPGVPPMLKAMVSAPALLFASIMAWRNVPAPLSAVEVTVKVVETDGARMPFNVGAFNLEPRIPCPLSTRPTALENPLELDGTRVLAVACSPSKRREDSSTKTPARMKAV
jgi:hypothetical protein